MTNNELIDKMYMSFNDGDLKTIKEIFKNVKLMDVYKNDGLIHASYYGHLELVKYLVDNGADIHCGNNMCFKYACRGSFGKCHLEIVKFMIEQGINVNIIEDELLKNKILNYIRRIKLKKYMKINNIVELIQNISNLSLDEFFKYSCEYDYLDGIKLLHKMSFINTSLIQTNLISGAIINNYVDIIEFSIENKLLSYDMNNFFYESLIFKRTEIINLLIKNGADIHVCNELVLNYAVNEKNVALIKYLIEHGSKINFLNNKEIKQMNILLRKEKINYLYEN